jgi:surface antigen
MPSVSPTTSFRQPIVIPATGKKSRGTMRPPGRSRTRLTGGLALAALILMTLLTSFIVLPLSTGGKLGFDLTGLGSRFYHNKDQNYNENLVAQAATATAIAHQDGYDKTGYNSGGTLYTGSGVTPDRFSFGQCTYYADMEYHRLTGYWVDWIGNAYQWASGASAAGWIVSSTPHVPSIIVLQPGVEGAGWYGHVAVVESINPDGSVNTSNMNWYDGGGWDRVSNWTFTPGRGVLFVWHA